MKEFRTSVRPAGGLRLLLALVVGSLLAIGMAIGAPPVGAQPATCSVTNADGGINVSWDAVHGASTYVYRLEVAGENNRYARVDDTSTFIGLPEGDVGTVFVSAILQDGGYSPSAACGSGQANDGSGQQQPTCSVTDADGGIDVSWSYITGAVEFVYRLEVAGQDNMYRREMGSSTFIGLSEGVVGTVFVSGVRANGTYLAAVPCGSGSAIDGSGQIDPTCVAESAEGGIRISWTAIDNADRYVYRLEVDGQNNNYGNVATGENPSTVVPLPEGTVGTLAVSAAFADGSYSPGVSCGTATAGGNGGGSGPANCSADQAPGGGDISWSSVTGAAGYIVYHSQYRTDVLNEIPTSGTSLYLDIPLNFGYRVSVAAVAADGSVSDRTECGYVEAGTPNGPECTVKNEGPTAAVTFQDVPYPTTFFEFTTVIAGVESTSILSPNPGNNYQLPLNGTPVTSARVRANIVAAGYGPSTTLLTLYSECEVSGSDNPQFPAGPLECSTIESTTDSPAAIRVDWSPVEAPQLSPTQTARYEVHFQIDNGGATFVEFVQNLATEFNSTPPDLTLENPWALYNGDVVSAQIRMVVVDTTSVSQDEGQFTDCGLETISQGTDPGGNADAPDTCSINGSTVVFNNQFDDLYRVRLEPFRGPHLFAFVTDDYEVQNVPSAAAGTRVFLAKVDAFDLPSAETFCGQITLNG